MQEDVAIVTVLHQSRPVITEIEGRYRSEKYNECDSYSVALKETTRSCRNELNTSIQNVEFEFIKKPS